MERAEQCRQPSPSRWQMPFGVTGGRASNTERGSQVTSHVTDVPQKAAADASTEGRCRQMDIATIQRPWPSLDRDHICQSLSGQDRRPATAGSRRPARRCRNPAFRPQRQPAHRRTEQNIVPSGTVTAMAPAVTGPMPGSAARPLLASSLRYTAMIPGAGTPVPASGRKATGNATKRRARSFPHLLNGVATGGNLGVGKMARRAEGPHPPPAALRFPGLRQHRHRLLTDRLQGNGTYPRPGRPAPSVDPPDRGASGAWPSQIAPASAACGLQGSSSAGSRARAAGTGPMMNGCASFGAGQEGRAFPGEPWSLLVGTVGPTRHPHPRRKAGGRSRPPSR